jgi:manganese oxidase
MLIQATVCLLAMLTVSTMSTTCGKGSDYSSHTRTYCIAVVDEDWNYAIASTEECYDLTNQYEEQAAIALSANGVPALGKYARKGLLREFPYLNSECDWNSNATVTSGDIYRNGILGPVIRAVVGDTIKVFFKNMATTLYEYEGDFGDDDGDFLANAVFNLIPDGVTPMQVSLRSN